ncbi:chromogranin-A [Nannospalax galili]|uniref:chromogranin-A n=1 Tax=Nannospalax galili TaxID=1026970 RepID=UPI0004ED3C89|nr:chromogranin-A [Nannospalax galili]
MHSAAVLALLLCAGQVSALPVNSPMTKGDTKVMKCVVEVISDSLSKPSPMPVSLECLETLQGDERILSILRHQNLLKELQDLALQGAKERAQQQPKQQQPKQQQHSSFEEELSEVLLNQSPEAKPGEAAAEAPSKDAVEKREDSEESQQEDSKETTEGPQAFPEPGQGSSMMGDSHAPGEDEATDTQPPAIFPNQEHQDPQATGDSEEDLNTQQQARKAEQEKEKEEEDEETGAKAGPEEVPTVASSSRPHLGNKEIEKDERRSESRAMDGVGKTSAAKARPPQEKGEQEHSWQKEEEAMAGVPRGLFTKGKGQELEQQQQEERLSKDWEDIKRWSRMDQLAKELTAEKRLKGEDDPDHSMKLSFRAQAYGFRDPGPQLRRGWRPSSREDSVEADLPMQVRGDPEEKKEEEGSANRRAEDQELESLSAIEAELENVAHQLQALRRG